RQSPSATDSGVPRIRTRPRAPGRYGCARAIAAPRSRRSSALRRGRKNERLSRTLPPEPAGGAARRGSGRHGALLQLIGDPPNDQIATEPQRRSSVIKCPPDTPQLLCRLTDQPGDFYQRQTLQRVLPAVVGTETAGRLARVRGSRSVVDWRFHRLVGSAMRYTRPRSSLAEARVSPSFFFKVPEKTPR